MRTATAPRNSHRRTQPGRLSLILSLIAAVVVIGVTAGVVLANPAPAAAQAAPVLISSLEVVGTTPANSGDNATNCAPSNPTSEYNLVMTAGAPLSRGGAEWLMGAAPGSAPSLVEPTSSPIDGAASWYIHPGFNVTQHLGGLRNVETGECFVEQLDVELNTADLPTSNITRVSVLVTDGVTLEWVAFSATPRT